MNLFQSPFKPGTLLKVNPDMYDIPHTVINTVTIKVIPYDVPGDSERNLRMLASKYNSTSWEDKTFCFSSDDPPIMYLGSIIVPPNPTTTTFPTPHDIEQIISKFLNEGKIWVIVTRDWQTLSKYFIDVTLKANNGR